MSGLQQGIYIGHTGRSFIERFNEHTSAFKTNSLISSYAKHILEQSHLFGPIHNTMQILQYHGKGTHPNTIERFYIYAEFSKNNHLNDEHTISPNKIFEAPTLSPPTQQNPDFPRNHTTRLAPQSRPYLQTNVIPTYKNSTK